MNFQSIFSTEITEALGWTIIHSLWQGAIVLTSLFVLLVFLRKNSSHVRYLISYTGLIIMLGWSVSTFVKAYLYAKEKQEIKQEMLSNPKYLAQLASKSETVTTKQTDLTNNINLQIIKTRAFFQRNFPLLLSIWLIGIALLTVRLLGGLAYTRKLRTLQLLPFEEEWINKLNIFAKALKIKKQVKAYKSPHTNNPITLGFFNPIILFPVKAFTGLSEKEIEAIIAHELAHILRNDYFFNILQSIIEIAFFYHPAIWVLSQKIRNEREHSCDDIAINLTGDKVTYAKALTRAQIFSFEQEQLSMAFGRKKGTLLQRIKRLQKTRIMKSNITEKLIAALIIIGSIFLVSFSVKSSFNNNQPDITEKSTSGNEDEIKTVKIIKYNKAQKDSLVASIEKDINNSNLNENVSKEIKQAIEIALSETNQALSSELFNEVNSALKDINFDAIVKETKMSIDSAMISINSDSIKNEVSIELKEAMKEVNKALNEINFESINIEVRKELAEARKEIRKELKNNPDIKDSIENIENIQEITDISLKAAEKGIEIAATVLEEIELDKIIEGSLKAAAVALEIAREEINNTNNHTDYEKVDNNEDEIKKQLKKDKEELKKELQELKKEMQKLKKEFKKRE